MNILDRSRLARASDLTLGTFLERFAAIRGSRPLVDEPDGWSATTADAADQVARAAGALAERIDVGDRVLVSTPNTYRAFLACLAVGRAGGVAVPVNPKMADDETDHIVGDADARGRIQDFDELVAASPGPVGAVPVDPSETAALFYTSGTTGRPKGARLSHRALVGPTGLGALVPSTLVPGGAVNGLPVSHIAGFTVLILLASIGVPVHHLPKFRPTDALDRIEATKASAFVGVPAMYRMMLEAGAEDRDLSSVRFWSSGADALPPELAETFQKLGSTLRIPFLERAVGRATFVDGYGMVELGGGVAVRAYLPVPLPVRGWLRPMVGNEIRIVDDEGQDVEPGEVGELLVRGSSTMSGYHGREEATAEVRADDGWVRTGDLARSRPLGFFELAGRKKDVIMNGGYSVFAVEVERVLEDHESVAEAAVLGRPDDRRGEVPVAAVRLLDGTATTADELIAWAGERLSDYKVPQQVLFVDEFPRTGTEKVQKSELADLFG